MIILSLRRRRTVSGCIHAVLVAAANLLERAAVFVFSTQLRGVSIACWPTDWRRWDMRDDAISRVRAAATDPLGAPGSSAWRLDLEPWIRADRVLPSFVRPPSDTVVS